MSKLELYINGIAGGYHNLMSVCGARREQVGVSTNDVDQMMRQALTILEGDKSYEPQLRVIDPGRIKCKTTDGVMTIALSKLRVWTSPSYCAADAHPDAMSTRAVPDDEISYRALGRHLVTN